MSAERPERSYGRAPDQLRPTVIEPGFVRPATGSDGDRFIFAVRVNDGLWLDGDYGHPEFFWEADGRFVFLRRKA